jgi:hypothetical protein
MVKGAERNVFEISVAVCDILIKAFCELENKDLHFPGLLNV